MIETRRLKNVVVFFQTILTFVLSRKIILYYDAQPGENSTFSKTQKLDIPVKILIIECNIVIENLSRLIKSNNCIFS